MTADALTDSALAKLSVAIVDDNAAMRGIVRAVLAAFGCTRVYESGDAKSALEIINANPVDVVIVDWKMSPIDGLALVRRLRDETKSTNPYLPIIMLTAYSDTAKVREARDAGVTEFMVKPFNASSLYQRLTSIVNRPRPFVRTKVFFGPDRRRLKKDGYDGDERREASPIH